jgi:hypothetical protein|tara:strand:- start:322 stop:498 length:177 start_codon:yes stop_codon:yes gene_type:complete
MSLLPSGALQLGTDRGKIYTLAAPAKPSSPAPAVPLGVDTCPAADLVLVERSDSHLGR